MRPERISWLSAERDAIQQELRRLADEHEGLRREPGKPFDWLGHRLHRESLHALTERIRHYRKLVSRSCPISL